MKRDEVQLSRDHLQRQAQCSPDAAIEELIWNGLDAGGNRVEVIFEENELGGLKGIEVRDYGTGINLHDIDRAFGTLGRSLKQERLKTPEGRVFHGSEGRGRFKALVLGQHATWNTVYRENGRLLSYKIQISRDSQKTYRYDDEPVETTDHTGTVVRIEEIDKPQGMLRSDRVHDRLTEHLALYLKSYPQVRVLYDGQQLDPNPLIAHYKEYELEPTNDSQLSATLAIIEWTFNLPRKKLVYADSHGFTWHEILSGVQFPEVSYTAYLKFSEARSWSEENRYALGETDDDLRALTDRAKGQLREHVRSRVAESAEDLVKQWKEEKIYPYVTEEPTTVVEKVERQVFDIVASRVHRYHRPFRDAEKESRQLTLSLVRQALETNPTSLRQILQEVLRLPKTQQDELADLLEATTLPAIITAAKEVKVRLTAIEGFDEILYGEPWHRRLRERTQLHRLLVHHLWIFGEEYTLDTDDDKLRKVLERHLRHLGRELLAEEKDPKHIDGSGAIPDLMISRQFKRDKDRLEHLVIELKRPSKPLGSDEIVQITHYAHAVAADNRFSRTEVGWKFVLIGNELDEYARREATKKNLPEGCLGEHDHYSIWTYKWSDILHQARARYRFFSERLELEATTDEGIEQLSREYPHLMSGKGMTKKQEAEYLSQEDKDPAS